MLIDFMVLCVLKVVFLIKVMEKVDVDVEFVLNLIVVGCFGVKVGNFCVYVECIDDEIVVLKVEFVGNLIELFKGLLVVFLMFEFFISIDVLCLWLCGVLLCG